MDSSVTASLPKQEAVTLADKLGDDVLAKLKAAKQDLTAKEQAATVNPYTDSLFLCFIGKILRFIGMIFVFIGTFSHEDMIIYTIFLE
ncbi:DUF3886 domain-containing protein [Lysinibacillus sp. JNUCC 51]|uniref:DUF3886 domain-containing protein n=1 Tax=Lysinibacillus sp. JNUCC-51 TaxID=2792479 RepID=UPI00308175FD